MSWFRKKNIKGKIYWYFVECVDNKEVQHYIGDDKAILNMISLHEVLCPGCKQRLALCGDGTYYCAQENKAYNLVELLPNKKVSDREKVVKVSKGSRRKIKGYLPGPGNLQQQTKLPNKIKHKTIVTADINKGSEGFGVIYDIRTSGFSESGNGGGGCPDKFNKTKADALLYLRNAVESHHKWLGHRKGKHEFKTTYHINGKIMEV